MDLFQARLGWISSPKNAQKVFANWWGTQCDDWWTIFELDEILGFSSSSENQVFFWPWSLWVSQGRWSDGHSEKKLWAADDQEKATEIHRFIFTLHPFVTVTCMKWTRGFPRKLFFFRSSLNDRNISPPDTCTKWWISTLQVIFWIIFGNWTYFSSCWGRFTGSCQMGSPELRSVPGSVGCERSEGCVSGRCERQDDGDGLRRWETTKEEVNEEEEQQ